MVGEISGAISAYKNAGKLQSGGEAQSAKSTDDSVGTFADLVKGGLQDAVQTAKQSEGVTAQYMLGNADITDVVMAVRDAEASITTITAIRDRVVNSIQEIMRMPI